MKLNELMIGDYVIRKNVPNEILIIVAIDSIRGRGIVYLDLDGLGITEKIENIEPIPLTADILEKNGFVKDKTQYDEDFYEFWSEDSDRCIYLYVYKEYFLLFDNSNMEIKYVHELQLAMQLCGIDKNIVI